MQIAVIPFRINSICDYSERRCRCCSSLLAECSPNLLMSVNLWLHAFNVPQPPPPPHSSHYSPACHAPTSPLAQLAPLYGRPKLMACKLRHSPSFFFFFWGWVVAFPCYVRTRTFTCYCCSCCSWLFGSLPTMILSIWVNLFNGSQKLIVWNILASLVLFFYKSAYMYIHIYFF